MQIKYIFLTSLLLAVSACGGGGGSSGSNIVVSPDPSVPITTGNGAQLASISGSGDSIVSNATGGIGALSVSQPSQNAITLKEFTREVLHLGQTHTLRPLAVYTCSNGGTLTAPDDPNASSGTLTFDNCEYFGVIVTGSLTFSGSGSTGNYSINVTYSNFTITVNSVTSTLNATMSIAGTSSGNIDTTHVSIPRFKVTVGTKYVSMYNYHYDEIYDNTSTAYTLSWDYSFESSSINGVVYVATVQDIQGFDSNPYPNTGSAVITGANKSHVRITINGTGQATDMVMVEFDEDGDGVYESSTSMTWTQFDALKVIF